MNPKELASMRDSLFDRTKALFEETARPVAETERHRRIERFDSVVAGLENRGGRVVLIRFPSSGRLRDLEERYYPRRTYWDVLARSTRAETIHFEDVPSLARFRCAEDSHLDRADSIRFTNALADELVRRKILKP